MSVFKMSCVLLCLVSATAYGQQAQPMDRLSIGFSAYLHLSGAHITKRAHFLPEVIKSAREDLMLVPAWSANGFLEYALGTATRIQVGLGLQTNGFGFKPDERPAGPNFNETVTARSFQHYLNMELPVNFKLYLARNTYWIAGGSVTYYMQNTFSTVFEQTDAPSRFSSSAVAFVDFREINGNINFGFGRDIALGSLCKAFIQPYFQYALWGPVKHNNMFLSQHLYSVGLMSGVRF